MNNERELTTNEAVSVLIQAARIGQTKGAYTIEDAELIARAIRVFVKTESNSIKTDESIE